ncbi:MAG: LysM peptidoglycan-binding domain-containing protein [Chloroflexi bacterium]|nr:LysM peptidoglycan-binding domain-containing protein [Chloroflexota bacterium]
MTQISHEDACRLISMSADQVLDSDKNSILMAHLVNCEDCRSYANEVNEVEIVLRKLGQKFSPRHAPLDAAQILSRSKKADPSSAPSFTFAKLGMMVFIVFTAAIVSWQFSTRNTVSPTAIYTAVPIPTPSTYLTSTNSILPNCEFTPYQIQEGDTLDSISEQFSVPAETIMDFNQMREEDIQPFRLIRVPLCAQTPTITIYPPNSTITTTPQFKPVTPTPG